MLCLGEGEWVLYMEYNDTTEEGRYLLRRSLGEGDG